MAGKSEAGSSFAGANATWFFTGLADADLVTQYQQWIIHNLPC